ncbi:MAG: DEAD/DEAH box helicase family protein [Oscillospiraceae bacterium]|nr:DEAD/DEAH box helicase family protein [Oscillospiraceae bacterium]
MENVFSRVAFRGTFRSYQQEVLDGADAYLADGHIHIAAAPGSGKTVLGLELIRRTGRPTLILSPTVTVRRQWGERFRELFLPDGEALEDYFSETLDSAARVCSITYQALHMASKPGGDGAPQWQEAVKRLKIGAICLDEAHHLRSEWQRSLEALLDFLGGDVTVIALTATPPYDSSAAEWERYVRVCGTIDAEIFVPELVAQKTLCPHQDYIYFNYPSADESEMLAQYAARAETAAAQIRAAGILDEDLRAVFGDSPEQKREQLLEDADELVALLSLAEALGGTAEKAWVRLLLPSGRLPRCGEEEAERALHFAMSRADLFGQERCARLHAILHENGLIEGGKLYLSADPALQKKMLSSLGKLESIPRIVEDEIAGCGRALRMLILTDHIRGNLLGLVGSDAPLNVMGAVTVFEAVRRVCPYETRLALLTGTLIIVPNALVGELFALAEARGFRCTVKALGESWYSTFECAGGSRDGVILLTEAFEKGLLHILVGTKALLGEGWDSPCVNTLVLASFVGSFISSNQMRGRAIRIDKHEPDKAANIWHLVTVLPPERRLSFLSETEEDNAVSEDYALLKRRFDCFMAPSYDGERIESGLERVDVVRPPFTRERVAEINAEMLARAADRRGMAASWDKALMKRPQGRVRESVRAGKEIRPRLYTAGAGGSAALHGVLLGAMGAICLSSPPTGALFALIPLMGVSAAGLVGDLRRSLGSVTPEKTLTRLGTALLETLRETSQIVSEEAALRIVPCGQGVECALENASVREKNLFAEAMGELLSPLDNPRYLFLRKLPLLGFQIDMPSQSYACPALLGGKKETAELLKQQLEKGGDHYELVYTRSEEGRKKLLECRRAANEGRLRAKVTRARSLGEN